MRNIDRDALDRAWDICLRTQNRGEQLPYVAKRDGKQRARAFAAGCAQHVALNLKPWEDAPALGERGGDRPQDKVLDRLLAAGLSRYEPDPIGARRESIHPSTKGGRRD